MTKIKVGGYVINLDELKSIRTHWIAFYVNNDDVTYFDSFEVKHIPKKPNKFIEKKYIITNIYRIPAFDLTMC